MDTFYTNEKNTLILIALLKAHGIKKVVASPGNTNISFIGSIQSDDYFEVFSSVDERSAAYIACGLAAESGEPVVISCTGATAARNYFPGLTEAFYRKLPILAVTSSQHLGRLGNNIPQFTDRNNPPKDVARISVQIPDISTSEDEWAYTVQMNRAILELTKNGGGPAHINLSTLYSREFNVKTLPTVKAIKRIDYYDEFPIIYGKKVGIFVGSHAKFSQELESAIDLFCEKFNAVVLCDHTSNYKGKYRVLASLITSHSFEHKVLDLMIHIGDMSGAYLNIKPKEVWRVSPDGEVRDTFRKLTHVFNMTEQTFFDKIVKQECNNAFDKDFLALWKNEYNKIYNKIAELPFSNAWVAKNTSKALPQNSVLHVGVLNSLRCWNYFEVDNSILGYCTTGGFGIDGCVSSLIGASIYNKEKLYFGIVGDLAFFYDMNSIGNRHIGNNLRLMIINNGKGAEFRIPGTAGDVFGEDTDTYMAAGGHYGNKSPELVKNYAENLGFEYLSASNKDEYMQVVNKFTDSIIGDKPIILEVFTNNEDESEALKLIYETEVSVEGAAKNIAKSILGKKGTEKVKKLLNK